VQNVFGNNDENTKAYVNVTIGSTSDRNYIHAFCSLVGTTHGGVDEASYKNVSQVEVSDVVSTSIQTLGHKILTTLGFSVVNILAQDDHLKIIPSEASCQIANTLQLSGDWIKLPSTGSARSFDVNVNHFGETKFCLRLSETGNPLNKWEEVSAPNVNVVIPEIFSMAPTRVVKNQQNN
jgi:hypothetical protein